LKGLDFDHETVAQFIRREFSQNVLNYVAGPLISTLFFYPSDETSLLLYLLLAKHMQATGMFTLRGGLGVLVQALAEHASIRHRPVDQIAASGSEYEIADEYFTHVVVAVPGNAVLRIRGIEEVLGAEDIEFFEGCRYQRTVAVAVKTARPLDGHCYAVSIPRVAKMNACTITFHDFIDSSCIEAGTGALSVIGGGDDVSESELLSDLQRIYPCHPIYTETTILPTSAVKFPPGRFRDIAAFESRPRRPGLFFCGDYLMGPFVEAAISTGIGAAERVLRSRDLE
jgi:protoporphyrinogen oxidase